MIREAGVEDLEAVVRIVRSATRHMEALGILQWDDVYPSLEILREDIERRDMHVLDDDGTIVGIIILNEDQPSEYENVGWLSEGSVLVVHRLAVDPRLERQGLATRLMKFAETFASAKGCCAIRLDAFAQNPGANALYDSLGYKKAGDVFFRKGRFHCFEKQLQIGDASKPLVVFDMDGTLYKTECVSLRAVRAGIADSRLSDQDDETICSLFGFTTPEICTLLFPNLSFEKLAALSERIRYYERLFIYRYGELYDGVRELLGFLKAQQWEIGLCTNGSETYVKTILSGMGLWEFFDVVRWKTAQNTKQECLREVAAGRHGLTVMVGDRKLDIEAAADAGVASVGVTWGYGLAEELEKATLVARNLEELRSGLLRLRLYHDLTSRIRAKIFLGNEPCIVGINGVDTAGKTRFSMEFSAYLKACGYDVLCVHLDDFHNQSPKRKEGASEREAYITNAFDLDKLDRSILSPFKEERVLDVELTLLDLATDEFSIIRSFTANEKTVMLLEGTLLFRAPVDRHLDYRIFLHIPFEEVLLRAKTRDVPLYGEAILDAYRRKYIPIQEWYLENHRPRERADAVIENTDFRFPKALD